MFDNLTTAHESGRHRLVAIGLAATLAWVNAASSAHAENRSGVPFPATPEFPVSDPVAYGAAVADHIERYDTGWVDLYVKSEMVLYDAKGDSVSRSVKQMGLEESQGDKGTLRFTEPPDISGVSVLVHQHEDRTDDQWLYLPASKRVRRISGANRAASFQGTEFTFEDLAALEANRYEWKFEGKETLQVGGKSHSVLKLDARPKDPDSGYSHLQVFVNPEGWRIEKTVFYDKARKLLKTLTLTRWVHHHGRFWRPHQLVMKNHQTGKRTEIRVQALFVNLALYRRDDGTPRANLSPSLFTRRALE